MMKLNEFMELEKREMSPQKMSENYKINTWKSKFHYKQFNSNNLESVFLDNNPQFVALKTMVEGYNDEVLEAKKVRKEVRNAGFRNEFYNNLINIMREIMLTKNREVQDQFVDKTYKWAIDTLSKLDYTAPKDDDKSLSSQTRPISGA